jgi:hypothetical protein
MALGSMSHIITYYMIVCLRYGRIPFFADYERNNTQLHLRVPTHAVLLIGV